MVDVLISAKELHDQLAREADRPLVLDVLDDGKGFNPDRIEAAPANGTGYGLSAMRHRLRQVGGTLEIESTPGDGTTVSASVPALYFDERHDGNEEHAG